MERKLLVKRSDLQTALLPILRCLNPKQRQATAAIWLEDEFASFKIGDTEARVSATGSWPGLVAFKTGFLIAYCEQFPEDDPVTIAFHDGRIRIGSFSVDCTVERFFHGWPRFVELPEDFSMLDILNILFDYTSEDIAHSGLGEITDVALEHMERIFDLGIEALKDELGYEQRKEIYPGGLRFEYDTLMDLFQNRAMESQ